ncbi:TPA: hypothetical protein ACX6PX_003586 [Photobacterium damselae]
MNFSPVVIFVYNRLTHTKKTIAALAENYNSDKTDLYIYSDGPKGSSDYDSIREIREYCKSIKCFRTVTINESEKNIGLAKNIINGVTEVIKKHGKIIVLEDDIVTAKDFINYMNASLNKYKDIDNVWHISGWNYPAFNHSDNNKAYLWRGMNCWGWATWEDKWSFYRKDPEYFINNFSEQMINKFNIDGKYDFWEQIKRNYNGELDTWAIFWYATIFINNGLCLNPYQTYVHNIGNDGSGENCGNLDVYKSSLNMNSLLIYPDKNVESKYAIEMLKKYFKKEKNIFYRIYRKAKLNLL